MALDTTGKTLTFGYANDIHQITILEDISLDYVAEVILGGDIETHLAQAAHGSSLNQALTNALIALSNSARPSVPPWACSTARSG